MKLVPMKDRLVVKILKAEEKTKSGIYLPDSSKEKNNQAEIVAVGQLEEGYDLKEGDKIVYESFGGTEVELDGEKYIILKTKDVLAKIE